MILSLQSIFELLKKSLGLCMRNWMVIVTSVSWALCVELCRGGIANGECNCLWIKLNCGALYSENPEAREAKN